MLTRRFVTPLAAAAAVAGSLVIAGPGPQAFAATCNTSQMTYSCFPNVSSEDSIIASPSFSGDYNNIIFCFETAGNVTWWKGLVVRGWNGEVVAELDTQDSNHGPACVLVKDSLIKQVEFWKAKFLGIHTLMYTMKGIDVIRPDLNTFYDGVVFDWTRDS